MQTFSDVCAIVVHHKNYPDVLQTLDSLTTTGINTEDILLVDNSEDDNIRESLRAALGEHLNVIFINNKGYANAVNTGIAWLLAHERLRRFLLVTTHEVLPLPDAVCHLRRTLLESSKAVVAGPTLVSQSDGGERVWSTGGYLERRLNTPRHYNVGDKLENVVDHATASRDWLDGSFCLYRSSYVMRHSLREDYFLYFEETDYHTQIRKNSGQVIWCPRAIVAQTTKGIPPYYLGRNLQIFQNFHGNTLQKVATVPIIIAHRIFKAIRREISAKDLVAMCKGWLSALSAS